MLVVDDEPDIRRFKSHALVSQGMKVETAADGPGALRQLREQTFDLVLLDVLLPGTTGLELLPLVFKLRPGPRVMMISALNEPRTRVRCLELGAVDYLPKPFVLAELIARIRIHTAAGNRNPRVQVEQRRSERRVHGPVPIRLLAAASHGLAAMVWTGALIVATAILLAGRGREQADLRRAVLLRLSAVAASCVAVLVLTGLVLAADRVASLDGWVVAGDDIGAPGRWQVRVVARRPGLADATATYDWTVGGATGTRPVRLSSAPLAGWWRRLAGLVAFCCAAELLVLRRRCRCSARTVPLPDDAARQLVAADA